MDAGGRPGCQAPGGKSGGLGLSTGTAGTGGGCGVRSRCGEDGAEAGITGEAGATTGPRFPSGGGRACVCSGLDNRGWGALPKPCRGGPRRAALGLRVPCEVAPARSRLLAKAGCEVHGAPRAVTGESRVSSLRRGHRVSCASLRPCVPPLVRPLARRAAVMFLRSQLSGSGSPRTMASRSLSYF